MVEKYDIRLSKKYLDLVDVPFDTSASRDFVVAVPLRGIVGDALFMRIGKLAQELKEAGLPSPFGSCDIKRSYTAAEIRSARLFMLRIPFTHFAAEECGTRYDESGTCEKCGLGSMQIGELRIAPGKLPRSRDIIRLWGGELIVTERLASLIPSSGLSGITLRRIINPSTRISAAPLNHSQLIVNSTPVELADRVRFGQHPFDFTSEGRCLCEAGEIAGAQPLTPLTIKESTWDGSDFCHTRVYVSSRAGFFRPHRILMVSRNFLELLQKAKIKGFGFEIVDVG